MTRVSATVQNGSESFISRRPLTAYFILAYAITWILWPLMTVLSLDLKSPLGGVINVAAGFGPTLAALILTVMLYGRNGLSQLFARLSPSQITTRLLWTAILLPFLIMLAAIVAAVLMVDSLPQNLVSGAWILPLLVEFIRITFIGGALGEEIGWRGFALPKLLANHAPFKASVILGLIWGVWHAPIYFVAGSGQNDMLQSGGSFVMLFPAFVVWVIGLAVLYTWVYKITNGNLLVAILFHAAINTAVFLPAAIGMQSGVVPLLNAGLTWIAALFVARTKTFREA